MATPRSSSVGAQKVSHPTLGTHAIELNLESSNHLLTEENIFSNSAEQEE